MHTLSLRQKSAIYLLTLCIVAAYIYSPGVPGFYVFDDFNAIAQNESIKIDKISANTLMGAALSSESGPLRRPLSMISFALNYYFCGEATACYKITNIIIHIINIVLVFLLANTLFATRTMRQWNNDNRLLASLSVAALWGLHPIQLTSVLYVVQRMNSLSVLFSLAAIIAYVKYRNSSSPSQIRSAAIISLCWLLAISAKETALLVPLYLLVIEAFFFNFTTNEKKDKRLVAFFIAVIAIPLIIGTAYLFTHGTLTSVYDTRTFTLTERVLTELRVVSWYLYQIIAPDISALSLYHDDLPTSKGFAAPATTLSSLIFWACLILFSFFAVKKERFGTLHIAGFAIAWFVAGHSLESTIIPLELVHEHRNYLPSIAAFIAIVTIARNISSHLNSSREEFIYLPIIILAMFYAIQTHARAQTWSNKHDFLAQTVTNRPNSPRAHFDIGSYYVNLANSDSNPAERKKFIKLAKNEFEQSSQLSRHSAVPALTSLYIGNIYLNDIDANSLKISLERLSSYPIDSATTNTLRLFVDCSIADQCHIDPNTILQLYTTTLSNKHLNKQNETVLLYYLSNYFGDYIRDYKTALYYADMALEVDNGFIPALFFKITWLSRLERKEEAKDTLSYLKEISPISELEHVQALENQLLHNDNK